MRALLSCLLLLGASLLLGGASWTEDQGELGTGADLLALGADVEGKMGPPVGPSVAGAALEAQTEEVAGVLRCPVCQGLSVADSPSESARNMKRQIRAMVAAGYDGDQITSYFVSAYGDFVLMAPVKEGFNLVVWAFPFGFFGLGGLMAVYMMRRGATRPDDEANEVPAVESPSASGGGDRPETAADLDPWIAQIRAEASEDSDHE